MINIDLKEYQGKIAKLLLIFGQVQTLKILGLFAVQFNKCKKFPVSFQEITR